MSQFQIFKWKIPGCTQKWAEEFAVGDEINSDDFEFHFQDGSKVVM
jgi:hypothetical protein